MDTEHKVFSFEEKILWVLTVVLGILVFYEHCSLPLMLHYPCGAPPASHHDAWLGKVL